VRINNLDIIDLSTLFLLSGGYGLLNILFTLLNFDIAVNAVFQVLILLVYSVIILRTFKRRNRYFTYIKEILKNNQLLIFFLLLCAVSIMWSVDKSLAVQRIIAFLLTSYIAIYFYVKYNTEKFITILYVSFYIVIIVSIFSVLIIPDLAIHRLDAHEGDWRGIFTHKNNLGWFTSLCIIISFSVLNKKVNIYRVAFLLLSLLLLIMSGSRTSWVALSIIIFVYFLIKNLKINKKLYYAILVLIVPVVIIFINYLFNNYDFILGLIGRDATLTGRINLWAHSFNAILDRPLLGYGFGTFWDSKIINEIWTWIWLPPHAHNGYVDLLLQLGILGFSVFIYLYVFYVTKSVYRLNKRFKFDTFIFTTFLIHLFILGFSADVLFRQNSIYWVIFLISVFNINDRTNYEKKD